MFCICFYHINRNSYLFKCRNGKIFLLLLLLLLFLTFILNIYLSSSLHTAPKDSLRLCTEGTRPQSRRNWQGKHLRRDEGQFRSSVSVILLISWFYVFTTLNALFFVFFCFLCLYMYLCKYSWDVFLYMLMYICVTFHQKVS